MRTKQEVINFLEGKVGTIVPCPGRPDLDGQCVTLIKALLEFLGAPDPYKARGHAKTVISAYLSEGIADPGTGFLSVFSNVSMGGGYGHIWCNAGDGAGTYYESNGAKALTVTKGKTYSRDFTCNLDKYIKDDMTDPLQECLAQHKKLVDEAKDKDEAIKELQDLLSTEKRKNMELQGRYNRLADEHDKCSKISVDVTEYATIGGKEMVINGGTITKITPTGSITGNYKIENE